VTRVRRTLKRLALTLLSVIVVMPLVAGPLGLGAAPLPSAGTLVTLPGGYRVNVLDEGTGPAVILVHGLPGSAYDWEPLPGLLRAAGCRVIRYDRVGYGHSDRRRDDVEHRVDVNGLELARLIDMMQLDRVVLAGWSYGGGVAVEAMGRSSRVTGVALLGSIGPATPPPMQVPRAVEWPRRWAVASGLPARAGILAFARLAFNASPPEGFTSHALSVIGASGVVHTFSEEAVRMAPASLPVRPLARIAVTVVHGTADRLSPVIAAEDLKRRVPSARLVTVPDGSHMLPNTHPALIRDELVDLVRRTGDACQPAS
jgi:pimeloyl-ACP methyl ester carboxylesterase